jgi:RNA polymerase sigma-70 factor (ECF subfamily)
MAEDILHDVFITFASAAKRLELRVNLKNYLIVSIANRVRDKYRKKTHNMVGLEKAGQISSDSHNPEHAAMFGEELQLAADAIYRLPFEQRETIILHLIGGLKFREIAQMLSISTSTVQGRYRYGIEKLRTELNGGDKNDSRR